MKPTILISFLLLCASLNSKAQLEEWPKMEKLEFEEIRTASNNILVAFFLGPDMNEISINPSDWSLNGENPVSIEKWITPNWRDVEFGYEHHIYLNMEKPLVQGQKYSLKSPHGNKEFTFDSKNIFCESIKTNQSAYSALSNVRYANFAIWTGTGGSKKIEGKLPQYEVFETESGKSVTNGSLIELGQNENSGDFVYRMDLSAVPEGGPYIVEVKGYGRSYPFGVGGEFSKKLSYISFRGLLHERCGIEQKKPYFEHDIRERCHRIVHITDAPTRPDLKIITPSIHPMIEPDPYGGHHDAGDSDRRDFHMITPMVLLTYYEMFPEYFTDMQYNIPDIFDHNMNPVGQGNGIPDIIDEAEWGTFIHEILQEENGGVRAGTEQVGYPGDEYTLDFDWGPYGTFRVENNSSTLAAGLFAHLARVLKPFKPERSVVLQDRAERAWAYAGGADDVIIGHKLNYLVQYYLLTGNEETHRELLKIAPEVVAVYQENHQDNPRRVHNTDILLGAHFFSYLVQDERPKDPEIVKHFENAIRRAADYRIKELESNPWPNGTSDPSRWWGSQTAQGQYADPLLMLWRLTGEQKYIDAASQLMDYNQGLNPIGKCFLTGIGFDRTTDPLHHDSYPIKDRGFGPTPGIQVFGPSDNRQQLKDKCPLMIPDISTMPAQRKWLDNRRNVSGCEFTVPESITYPSVVYTVLAGGGTWNRNIEPFDE